MVSKLGARFLPAGLLLAGLLLMGCAGGFDEGEGAPAEEPGDPPPLNSPTPAPTMTAAAATIEQTLAQIDAQLRAAAAGTLAYNAPSEMSLNQSEEITLLVSPTLSQAGLADALSDEPGATQTAAVQVTPRMRARLVGPGQGLMEIVDLHESNEQFISAAEPTEWRWQVTARQSGQHRLTLTVSRLVQVDQEESWRLLDTYRFPIDVRVTLGDRVTA
ncbi:MAG: hypothetical protein R3300_20255, partial [Candidatus Promineifilaceae bacterium]|nr:hypothetical protein [Candidatus Promineifilaceae bacterium]